MTRRGRHVKFTAALVAGLAIAAAACGSDGERGEPMDQETAVERLAELADEIDWVDDPVSRTASIPPPTGGNLAETLPPLDEFPLNVQAPPSADVVLEIWSSTEKSGQGTDGWMREATEDFNRERVTLADGRIVGVDLRYIASGTGYQFIARGRELPHAFTPSN